MRKILSIFLLVLCAQTAHAQAWSNILSPSRGTDWTGAGVTGGIPSTAWTQCGATLTPGAVGSSAALINNTIATCGANQCVVLSAGTFNLATGIQSVGKSNWCLRGQGPNSTFLVAAPGFTSSTCRDNVFGCAISGNSEGPSGNSPPATVYTVSSGAVQGSTSLTLSSVFGIVANQTILVISQCPTGKTGNPCAGTSTDNGQLFQCNDQFSSPNGCSTNGPDGGLGWVDHFHQEMILVTNVAGNVVTLAQPLRYPDWNASQTPVVWFFQPISNFGFENMSIDTTNIVSGNGSNPNVAINFGRATNAWVHNVKLVQIPLLGFYCFICTHVTVDNSYMFGSNGSLINIAHGVDLTMTADVLVQNNIFQGIAVPIHGEGPAMASVFGYNFMVNDAYASDTMTPPIEMHSQGGDFTLPEGNIGPGLWIDINHGTQNFNVPFRNFFTGWETCASGQCGASAAKDFRTFAIAFDPFNRYNAAIANVLGTGPYHNTYKSTPGANKTLLWLAAVNGGVPTDALVSPNTMLWGNYDVITAAVRFCGGPLNTGWSTTCGSLSETAGANATLPNQIPTQGDTSFQVVNGCPGECVMPSSFYLPSKPSWFQSLTYPPIGPDVSGGNVGACNGTINTVGQFGGVPATNASQCAGQGLNAASWAGHVNAIPAMNCFLSVMGGKVDGSDASALAFDPATCYAGAGPGLPTVSLSPTSLSFGNVALGSSPQLTTTLTNTGTGTLNISSLSIIGTNAADFSQSNTCGSVVPAGSNCTITVTFTPNVVGAESASVSISDNASGSPQQVPLTGTGTKAVAQINPASLNFGTFTVGVTSGALQITVTNIGNSNLLITSITIGGANPGDFAQGNTCVNVGLAPTNSCFINVTFTPTATGARTAIISIVGNQLGGTASVPLTGAGTMGTALQGITIQGATIK